jgi:hypothetical protein
MGAVATVLSGPVFAQSVPLFQEGQVLPNDVAKFTRNGVARNPGTIAGDNNGMGVNPFAATDNGQLGICSNSRKTTGPYAQICIGHDTAGNALLDVSSRAGEPNHSLKCIVNGVEIANCLGAAASPLVPPIDLIDNKTGAITTTGATLGARTSASVSADDIEAYVFCTSATPVSSCGGGNYDGVRGVGISNPGSTVPIVAGISGYVLANQAFAGVGPSSVALFGTGAVTVDGGSVWGLNTNVSDRQYRVAQPSGTHHRRVTGAEIDVSASYPDTDIAGILIAGNSVVQPNNSTAVAVVGQDFSASVPGSIARWTQAFYTYPGTAIHFANIGMLTSSTVNSNSQDMIWGAYVNSAAYQGLFYFGVADAPLAGNFGSTTQPSFNMNYALQVWTGGFTARTTANEMIQLGGHIDLGSGASIESRNDAGTLVQPLEILAADIFLNSNVLHVNNGSGITLGATCTGSPTSSFATINGIVTAC